MGEGGIYLHGLPYWMAPEAQKQVPALFWLGQSMSNLYAERIKAKKDQQFTHDHIVHTILGMMHIETPEYQEDLDILSVHP